MGADLLSPDAMAQHLRGRFGRPYLYEPECESTQDLLSADLPEGAVAATEHQTGGRGRLGRRWDAPRGSSVLVSLLLRPPAERRAPELALVAALAVAEAVEWATGARAGLKWPNDVLLDGRKVAGILAELRGSAVVLGVGVNVNQDASELPTAAPTPPGSLRSITGSTHNRAVLLGTVLERLESRYDTWRSTGLSALLGEIRARDALRGRRIVVDGDEVTALRIGDDGRLEVEIDDGEHRAVESGEVSLGG